MTVNYTHLASRLFDRPLLVTPDKARLVLAALSPRLNVGPVALREPGKREVWSAEALEGERLAALELERPPYDGERLFDFDAESGIAYIPVFGTLVQRNGLDPFSGMTGYDGIAVKLREALADTAVRGILMEIDSPGGEVSGAFDLADEIREARSVKPIWAVANELAASAGYAIASAAERLFAPRTALLGSIGVVVMHADFSRALDEMGVTVTLIHAGAHKVDGNSFAPLPDEVRNDLQTELEATWQIFIDTVAQARALEANAVRATEARVYRAEEALSLGLIDGVAPARAVARAFAEELQAVSPV